MTKSIYPLYSPFKTTITLPMPRIELARAWAITANGTERLWQANPYPARITLQETGGRAPRYLTLAGNGHEVAIGAFLSPEERIRLAADLHAAFAATHFAFSYPTAAKPNPAGQPRCPPPKTAYPKPDP